MQEMCIRDSLFIIFITFILFILFIRRRKAANVMNRMNRMNRIVIIVIIPVSYTHLDVYKRQICRRAASRRLSNWWQVQR